MHGVHVYDSTARLSLAGNTTPVTSMLDMHAYGVRIPATVCSIHSKGPSRCCRGRPARQITNCSKLAPAGALLHTLTTESVGTLAHSARSHGRSNIIMM
jgi:hypothetical protein